MNIYQAKCTTQHKTFLIFNNLLQKLLLLFFEILGQFNEKRNNRVIWQELFLGFQFDIATLNYHYSQRQNNSFSSIRENVNFQSLLFLGNVYIYNHSQNILDKNLFSCEIEHYGKFLFFQEIFGSIDKIFISGGGLSTGQ